jgi:hypothetical protein
VTEKVTHGWMGRAGDGAARRHRASPSPDRNATPWTTSPEAERPLVQRRLRTAWATLDPDQAQHELETLARGLARQRPGAAASLRKGVAETLTVNRLGVGGKLLQIVELTNPVEHDRDRA